MPSAKPEAVRETHKTESLRESDGDREMGERQREREQQSLGGSRALRQKGTVTKIHADRERQQQ